ncbi:(2,3-dihydroxybenzoyl)adenylate synthase [Actinoallomurus bryophytorum]|uniref:2,3-dihydroxybenzoate-AMP ligase n=1 Tax=Actinoallomurus bryophytorum TaxID=1490222 RepID=A0A543CUS4_9ACTN|nr:AMP-binding protein [Actinoallomurus bryophytorum]TQM00864.1 2,3-dihydroxybenzoate-AMP ligase [Actinoallomurus bryophytorum]
MDTPTDPGMVPWPADQAARYTAAGHWRGRPLGHWMWTWARRRGPHTAVVDGDRRISYLELARRADALADHLLDHGLGNGDKIVVQLPGGWKYLTLFFACQRIGVVPVLALMAHRERELAYFADLAGAKALVVPDEFNDFDHQELAADVARDGDRSLQVFVTGPGCRDGHVALDPLMEMPDDGEGLRGKLNALAPGSRQLALLLLSGGTTGMSKLVPRTHDDYEYNARRSAEVSGFGPGTVYLVVLPAAHNFPLGSPGILGTLLSGGRVVFAPSPRPEVAFPLIERERVTVTSLVPSIAQRWVEAAAVESYDLSCLHVVQVGGSVLAPEFAARVGAALGCTLQQVYGMAEGLLNYTRLDDPESVVLRTQGRPISPDDEVRIVDEFRRPVPPGTPGELQARGPYTIRGYYAAPESNAVTFTSDGWYRSGDIVRMHPTGNLVVEGRIKDVINRGGEKISATEVEAVVKALPQVAQAAAIPVPDPVLGERICVCVVLRPGGDLTLDELRREDGVAKYKIPEQLEIFTDLPLTPVGKVDKKELCILVERRRGSRQEIPPLGDVGVPTP